MTDQDMDTEAWMSAARERARKDAAGFVDQIVAKAKAETPSEFEYGQRTVSLAMLAAAVVELQQQMKEIGRAV